MNILLVVATPFEVLPLVKKLPAAAVNSSGLQTYQLNGNTLTVLITGVGMVATAFSLGKYLDSSYGLALNAGIAGSFNYNLPIGEVVHVYEDCFAELGAEDGDNFLTIDQLGFGSNLINSTNNIIANKQLEQLTKVNGITVNKVHGNALNIEKTIARFHPIIESMEGAAFLYACQKSNVSCAQLRAISNYVEKRNKAAWNIPLAISNLNGVLENILYAF